MSGVCRNRLLVPLGLSITEPYTVQHAIAEKPMFAGARLGVRPSAQIYTIETRMGCCLAQITWSRCALVALVSNCPVKTMVGFSLLSLPSISSLQRLKGAARLTSSAQLTAHDGTRGPEKKGTRIRTSVATQTPSTSAIETRNRRVLLRRVTTGVVAARHCA